MSFLNNILITMLFNHKGLNKSFLNNAEITLLFKFNGGKSMKYSVIIRNLNIGYFYKFIYKIDSS